MSEPMIGYQCRECRHIRQDYSCDAFPDGMPWDIVMGFDHSQPLDGDNGIRFERRTAGEAPPVFISLDMEELEPSRISEEPLT